MLKNIKSTLAERLNNYEAITETGCWIWMGSISRNGYGQIEENGKNLRPHRVSYSLNNGVIPKGNIIMHACDVPACINPDHLVSGTQKQNMADMVRKRRSLFGERAVKSILTEQQVLNIRLSRENNTALGKKYGVDRTTVGKIKQRINWSYL